MSLVLSDPLLDELLVGRVTRSPRLSLQLLDDFLPGLPHRFIHCIWGPDVCLACCEVTQLRYRAARTGFNSFQRGFSLSLLSIGATCKA